MTKEELEKRNLTTVFEWWQGGKAAWRRGEKGAVVTRLWRGGCVKEVRMPRKGGRGEEARRLWQGCEDAMTMR